MKSIFAVRHNILKAIQNNDAELLKEVRLNYIHPGIDTEHSSYQLEYGYTLKELINITKLEENVLVPNVLALDKDQCLIVNTFGENPFDQNIQIQKVRFYPILLNKNLHIYLKYPLSF